MFAIAVTGHENLARENQLTENGCDLAKMGARYLTYPVCAQLQGLSVSDLHGMIVGGHDGKVYYLEIPQHLGVK